MVPKTQGQTSGPDSQVRAQPIQSLNVQNAAPKCLLRGRVIVARFANCVVLSAREQTREAGDTSVLPDTLPSEFVPKTVPAGRFDHYEVLKSETGDRLNWAAAQWA